MTFKKSARYLIIAALLLEGGILWLIARNAGSTLRDAGYFFSAPAAITPPVIPPMTTFTPTPTATPSSTPTITPTPTVTPPAMSVQRVIIVSFDGLRPDAIQSAPMPVLQGMMLNGAYTLRARTINYAVTLPGHASMLSGLCQSRHGVWWDTPIWGNGYAKGVDVFDLAHAAGLRTVMIVNKEKMRQLAEPETTDVYQLVYGQEPVIMQKAVDEFANGFDLMFIHFGSPDNRGHKYGWMSGTYLKAARALDDALAQLLDGLEEHGLRDGTLIIVSADHGGHDKEHVGNIIQDLEIPWVAYGAGVQPGLLPNPVSIMDIGPTAAYALELPLQAEWDGHPAYEVFGLPAQEIHPANFRICK